MSENSEPQTLIEAIHYFSDPNVCSSIDWQDG